MILSINAPALYSIIILDPWALSSGQLVLSAVQLVAQSLALQSFLEWRFHVRPVSKHHCRMEAPPCTAQSGDRKTATESPSLRQIDSSSLRYSSCRVRSAWKMTEKHMHEMRELLRVLTRPCTYKIRIVSASWVAFALP
jgi:hypothetical protein